MKKALITGSLGFVGPYLAAELKERGYEVVGIDHRDVVAPDYWRADITDYDQLRAAVIKIQPTHVFHLAGFSSPAAAEKNPTLTQQVNVGGTKNLLEALLTLPAPPRVLIISSMHVYGAPQYLPVDEKHPLTGAGVYAQSRQAQEELARGYFDRLNIVVARSFNHTGPGQPADFIIPKILRGATEIKKGLRAGLELGNLDVKRDITDVRDVARAYRLLLEQDAYGLVCNVCRGQSVSLQEVIKHATILSRLDNLPVTVNPQFVRADDPADIYGDNGYLKRLTGWECKIDYDRMFKDIYDYWEACV